MRARRIALFLVYTSHFCLLTAQRSVISGELLPAFLQKPSRVLRFYTPQTRHPSREFRQRTRTIALSLETHRLRLTVEWKARLREVMKRSGCSDLPQQTEIIFILAGTERAYPKQSGEG